MAQTSSIELTDAETKKNLVSSTLSFKKRVNDDSDGVMWYEKLTEFDRAEQTRTELLEDQTW